MNKKNALSVRFGKSVFRENYLSSSSSFFSLLLFSFFLFTSFCHRYLPFLKQIEVIR